MIEIQGYWLVNGHKTEFIPDVNVIHENQLEEYRKSLSIIWQHNVMFKHRIIPEEIRRLILSDFMENTPTIQSLADKYGVSTKFINGILTNYLTNDNL
jgi:hypothetical protein